MCLPFYDKLCAPRYRAQELIREGAYCIDLAFLMGVFMYSTSLGKRSFPLGLYAWPLRDSEFLALEDDASSLLAPRVPIAG